MIVLGVILMLLSWLLDLGPFDRIAWVVGLILLVVGLVLLVLGFMGKAVGGRKHYY